MDDAFDEAVIEAAAWVGPPHFTDNTRGVSVDRWEFADGESGLEICRSRSGHIDMAAHHGGLHGPMKVWVLADPHAVAIAMAFINVLGRPPPATVITPPKAAVHEALAWLRESGVALPSVAT